MSRLHVTVAFVGLGLIQLTGGCHDEDPQSPTTQNRAAYEAAVRSAAVFNDRNLRRLTTIAGDKVVVAAWVGPFYSEGSQKLEREVWVTVVPELQQACRNTTGDLDLGLKQLLGLPPEGGYSEVVIMEVEAKDVFRPCLNHDITRPTCDRRLDNSTEESRKWFSERMIASYRWPGGYPWTGLGYTYNWNPNASDRKGLTEFVIKKDAPVRVTEIRPTAEYCRRPQASP